MPSCRDACREAADSISRILRIFDRLYTLRRINVQAVHLIFTASLIHVFDACGSSSSDARDAAAAQLETCCYALRAMGQQFKNAIRALEVIIYLKGELLNRWRANYKRPIFSQIQDVASPKRQCLSIDTDYGAQSSIRETLSCPPNNDELDYLSIDDQCQFEMSLGNDFNFDSPFWADLTTIETPHNTTWTL